ncbi:E1-E2 ATPase-domain-containing protein [Boletus edulis BED1]|uniref:P-type H(+)-exporting transporter n=1 Tax=Boletus edulis BED1 TaxID=1328754 RepID=A0AAD4BA76_BOLED|nr:E1-E2 ATPase-domain-containing protein [Boletus edulis BED1]
MATVLSITLAVGAQQLAKHEAIVTCITAIEELAGVTILCSDKTGTLTTNKLTIDRATIHTYGPFSTNDIMLLAAYASRTEDQDAIDASVVAALGDSSHAHAGIKHLDFKPFNPVDKRMEIAYLEESSGKLKHITKGMTGIIIELCTRNKTDEIVNKLEADVEEFASRGLRALANGHCLRRKIPSKLLTMPHEREYKEFGHDEEKLTHANVNMSLIKLKAEDLYDKEKVDLETIVIDDVFKLLQCDEGGLSQEGAQCRIELFSPNKLEQEEQNAFFRFMWNLLSWVMEDATLMAIVLSNGEGQPPDWQDFLGIVILLFVNSTISFYEERNAGNAVKALMDSLAPKAKVKHNGTWSEIESAGLVPGDMISSKIGDTIPTNCHLTEVINVSIDQAALTGESLPQSKKVADQCFSGSTCKQGEAEGVVISTGTNTFFSRAASLVGQDDDTTGHLQKILAQIGSFCLVSIGIFVVAEILVLYAGFKYNYRHGLICVIKQKLPTPRIQTIHSQQSLASNLLDYQNWCAKAHSKHLHT